MEFIGSETLQDATKKVPFKLSDAVNITLIMAEAMKAEHEKLYDPVIY